jgi:hypothetical protein
MPGPSVTARGRFGGQPPPVVMNHGSLSRGGTVRGVGNLVYGGYEFVQPGQPPPGHVFWAWILGMVLVAAVATAVV